ncbi:hypothetical protein B0H12DRAFT_361177 [Mycena haematopus]|nr:hypothetical protein B0H12DRAFT_361177 [Mycena haematopus]
MRLWQLPRNLLRKSRTTPPSGKSSNDDHGFVTIPEKKPQSMTETRTASPVLEFAPEAEKKPQPIIDAETARTASNVLELALRILRAVSDSILVAGALSGIIDSLLGIMGQIKQTSANAHGLTQLAARIERLTPIVAQMKDDPDKGQTFVRNLQQALVSMTADLEAARSKGKLNRFFNSADNALILHKYNAILAQMIADPRLSPSRKLPILFATLRQNSKSLLPPKYRLCWATSQEDLAAVRTSAARVAKAEASNFTWTPMKDGQNCKSPTPAKDRWATSQVRIFSA